MLQNSKGCFITIHKNWDKVNIARFFFIIYNYFMLFKLSKKSLSFIFSILILLSYPAYAKDVITLPKIIENKISQFPATKSSWYIRNASGSKAGKVIYGPFENKEQALCVWIYLNLQENKRQCISKNESFITKSPSVFYKKECDYLKSQIAEYGMDAVLDKYFFDIDFEIEEQPALTQAFENSQLEAPQIEEQPALTQSFENPQLEAPQIEEAVTESEETVKEIATDSELLQETKSIVTNELIDSPELEVVQEEKIEPVIVTQEVKEEIIEPVIVTEEIKEEIIEPVIITQEINEETTRISESYSIIENSETLPAESVSRYKKEYLQDYAPIKTAPLPVEEEEIIEYIIENPNQTDDKGRTLLMKACENGNDWEIENLLKSGADVNLKDNDGWTALMYAVRYQQNVSTVKSLINAGANIKEKNEYDLSALLITATYNDNPEILKLLTASYSISEKELLQAFIMVLSSNTGSEYSTIAKVKIFIDAGIPLNVFYQGKTPLMYAAAFSKSTSVIKMLLQNGAQTQIRSIDGKTAFDYARENKALPQDEYYWALNQK